MRVRVIHEDSGKKYRITIQKSTTVWEIKEIIQNLAQIPADRQILFLDRELDDEKTAEDYNIEGNDTILLRGYIFIIVNAPDGNTYFVETSIFPTIHDIKVLLRQHIPDIQVFNMRLKLNGRTLSDGNNTSLYGIGHESELDLHIV